MGEQYRLYSYRGEDVDGIQLAKDKDCWQALENKSTMNLLVP
jgi:hypothetical protein